MLERDGFFEQEIARKADTFGDFAHVWSTYESRHSKDDATPFLRGINSIQLCKQGVVVLRDPVGTRDGCGRSPAQCCPRSDGVSLRAWQNARA
jgi:hypothetical protein